MTRDEILKMEAGRELDELIAMHIMGYSEIIPRPKTWVCTFQYGLKNKDGDVICPNCQLHPYSSNISDAWEVVEKMKEGFAKIDLFYEYHDDPDDGWYCSLGKNPQSIVGPNDTAPLAICKAALLVVTETQ